MTKHPARKPPTTVGRAAPAALPPDANAPVQSWQDDPANPFQEWVPVPDPSLKPLAFALPTPQPPPGTYQLGTPEFRWWNAAAALRRTATFWGARLGVQDWQIGPTLPVSLDYGEDLNAYYDREALRFFHGPGDGGTVFSGESPDILCHEMGHAVLDTIKPQLWDAVSPEPPAFHEAFADISAILSALQLPSMCKAVLDDTQGQFYRASRLSRLAEQLGAAIRLQYPDQVEVDCLRNAVNSFTYHDPVNLPQMAPASQLSAEPHNFSRVFTAAFFEILGAMLHAKAALPNEPAPAELAQVSIEAADILVAGVRQAPVVPNFYAQVAGSMVQASAAVSAAYPPLLKSVFVRRSILSLSSAAAVQALQRSEAPAVAATLAAAQTEPLATVALSADDYGLDKPLLVHAASHSRAFVARAAAVVGNGSVEPASSSTAARAYVDDLFSRGNVDYGGMGDPARRLEHRGRVRTHKLVAESGAIRLHRCLFDCGFAR